MCSQQIEGTDDEKDKCYITGCPLLHVTQHEIQGPLKYFSGPFLADSRTFCSICYSTFLRMSVFTSFFFLIQELSGIWKDHENFDKTLGPAYGFTNNCLGTMYILSLYAYNYLFGTG